MTNLSAKDASHIIVEITNAAAVIPVLTVHDSSIAQPLARALVDGGLPILEVTLRTPCAFEVIAAMTQIKGAVVAAGTLITAQDVKKAKAAGAIFGVSPGVTDSLIAACAKENLPLLAGVASVSEAMHMLVRGYYFCKFFPAESSGGINFIKAVAAPLPMMHFCPTGGIIADNAGFYLKESNVNCVGGSWIAPQKAINNKDWYKIHTLATIAAKL